MGFFGYLFSLFRKTPPSELIEDQLEERRLRPRINPKEETRVLVIDDSPTILTAMKRFLESAHCIFLGAVDAKMGMEVALTQKPDLIFLDIVMPGINGFAALRALRKNSRTRDIPIIMMSGNEQAKAQFFGAHIGADDFMKKPFSRFEVFARVARLLDDNRIPRRLPVSGVVAQASNEASAPPAQAETPSSQSDAPPASPSATTPIIVKDVAPLPPAPALAKPEFAAESVIALAQQSAIPVLVAAEPQPEPIHQVNGQTNGQLSGQSGQGNAQTNPPHTISAQVVSISPAPIQHTPPSVSPELLARISRLAQLAQADPEALKALIVLAAQLVAQAAQITAPAETAPPPVAAQARAAAAT